MEARILRARLSNYRCEKFRGQKRMKKKGAFSKTILKLKDSIYLNSDWPSAVSIIEEERVGW